MASLGELARRHTTLSVSARSHLRRLVGSWGPLADLSFSDMLLYAPVDGRDEFVVLGQIRPTTDQTVYIDDQVGVMRNRDEVPTVAKSHASGAVIEDGLELEDGSSGQVTAIPVSHNGQLVAVVARVTRTRSAEWSRSDLAVAYLGVFERLTSMIVDGTFPFPFEDAVTEESPRVGDGALVLDADTRVEYSSPNAVSALHRIGYHGRINGQKVHELGFHDDVITGAYRLKAPVIEELERGDDTTILGRVLPLLMGNEVSGALLLVRDVSDLRRRDRLLVSQKATISEIHHRVKNNLQTVSSLLRIQGRRVDSPAAKAAIEESVRRIGAIAVVHQMLAESGGDAVAFTEVLRPIVNMAETTLVSADRPIEFKLVGEGTTLSANRASSLAVVVTELLQNAIEHGYPAGSSGGEITVEMVTSLTEFRVRVHDDGVGVPADFDITKSSGLGLTIISALASGELAGELQVRPALPPQSGTMAEIRIQLREGD